MSSLWEIAAASCSLPGFGLDTSSMSARRSCSSRPPTVSSCWRGDGSSLADRLCLAVAERLDVDVLTADTHWGSSGRVRQIR